MKKRGKDAIASTLVVLGTMIVLIAVSTSDAKVLVPYDTTLASDVVLVAISILGFLVLWTGVSLMKK